jgi:hypothetical protein
MEAITSAVAGPGAQGAHVHAGEEHHGPAAGRLTLDPADSYAPCDRFADPYAESCWLFQGFVILRLDGFDPARALHTCDAAPSGWSGRCYESVGHQVAGLFQRGDEWIVEQCRKGRPALAPRCAAGAALALAAGDWSGGRAGRFCAASPGEWKTACYHMTAVALTALASAGRRATLCAEVEPAYSEVCRRASGFRGGTSSSETAGGS